VPDQAHPSKLSQESFHSLEDAEQNVHQILFRISNECLLVHTTFKLGAMPSESFKDGLLEEQTCEWTGCEPTLADLPICRCWSPDRCLLHQSTGPTFPAMQPAMPTPTEWLIPFFWMLLLSKDSQEEEEDVCGPEEEPAEGAHQPNPDQNNEQQQCHQRL
jgi:hypothetical protein